MVNRTALTILISIILTIIIISLVNVGTSLFFEEPSYYDYCELNDSPYKFDNISEEDRIAYEEANKACNDAYNTAREEFNQQRFYIFAAIGFILLIVGLFSKENLIQITGLATGGILVFQGIVTNLQDKLIVFISLLLMLLIFGVLAYRVVTKEDVRLKKSKKKK